MIIITKKSLVDLSIWKFLILSEKLMKQKFAFAFAWGCINLKLNDCIRNTTAVCNPRQIQSETKFSMRQNLRKKFLLEKKLSEKRICLRRCLGFPAWVFLTIVSHTL